MNMDYKSLLNESQYKAVSSDSQYTRIVAGAGSGKTRVLTYKIAYLISEKGINPKNILAVTFTNKVAKEMKDRISRLLPNLTSNLSISTFHSFCVRFLKEEIKNLDITPNFTILDDDDKDKIIKDICGLKGYGKKDPFTSSATRFIEYHKCRGHYPNNVHVKYDEEKEYLEVFKEYELSKDRMLGLDFDDLLLKTIIILENFPEVRLKWNRKITHILIDEFQDTNDVQFKLLKLLTNENSYVSVVGDPDQTIYTWRGANQKIILDFEKTFKGAETIILDQNYRSTKTILDAANKLISNNKDRVPKDLFTNNINGDKIELFKGATKEVEASHVISQIKRLVADKKVESYREIAILYRSGYLSLALEKELVKQKLNYRIFGSVRFYQRAEIKDVLAYFKLMVNPLDDVSFERIINVPKRKIGDKSISIIKAEANRNNLSMFNYIKNINDDSALNKNVITTLKELLNKIEDTKNKLNNDDELYTKILEDFLYSIGYYNHLELDENAEERIDNVKTLFNDMFDFIKKNPDDGFLAWLNNCAIASAQDEMKDDDYISLMTVHTAKGLEFNHVFIVGLSEGVFPNQRAVNEDGRDGLEEERRLCYVAFTRAKKNLYLSMNNGFSYVVEGNPIESRFISESDLKMPSNPTFEINPSYVRSYGMRYKDNDDSDRGYYPDQEVFAEVSNGINDWHVGDELNHDKFGHGVVTKVISSSIIEVSFDDWGIKHMLSSHHALKRIKIKIEDMN